MSQGGDSHDEADHQAREQDFTEDDNVPEEDAEVSMEEIPEEEESRVDDTMQQDKVRGRVTASLRFD